MPQSRGGAWGTALATTALRAGHGCHLWARDAETVVAINARHENPRYLPGVPLDPALAATTDLDAALLDAACILAVVPAQAMRGLLETLAPRLSGDVPLVLCAKGIERGSGKLLSELAAELLPRTPVAALSGPSFAADVARGLPTAVTVAAEDEARRRGCIGTYVDTYSFQAPGFYARQGYAAFGTLEDLPPGGSRTWFAKRL